MAIKKISKRKMTSKEIRSRKEILKELAELEASGKLVGTAALPLDASLVEIMKWDTCKEIIIFKHTMNYSSKKMSEIMKVDKARTSEILHYRVNSFTLDRLLNCLESLKGQVPETDKKLYKISKVFSSEKKIA